MMNQTQSFQPGTGIEPTSRIEISISCKDLLDKDIFSRSDPMVVVYQSLWRTGRDCWTEILRTEVIQDSVNPEFTEKLVIDYRFEEEQKLRFEVYDIDEETSNNLSHQDFLGVCECTIATIVSAGFRGLSVALKQDKNNYEKTTKKISKGSITLIAEELVHLKEEAIIQLAGKSTGHGFLWCFPGKLFFTISKLNEGGKYILVHKSEVVPGPHPSWAVLSVTTAKLCNGDKDRGLKIDIFKEGLNGYHTLVGGVVTNLNKLAAAAASPSNQTKDKGFPLMDANGATLSSKLAVVQCKFVPIHTFLDYIQAGTSIHCSFAIDMTGSNGDPSSPSSLHYINPSGVQPNPYQQAINSVGQIIEPYSHSKLFSALGFGARIPPNGVTSHKFNLNLEDPTFLCSGIPQVLQAYGNTISRVQLFGPTNFSPIIQEISAHALQNCDGKNYFVLLIITDGVISDMNECKEAIVNASTLPLSIIIVGVGNANFDAMEQLDGDTVRLSSRGRFCARDIVQFVAYRDAYSWMSSSGEGQNGRQYANNTDTYRLAQARLAKEVLAEIPLQLTSFMKSRSISPTGSSIRPVGFVSGVLPQ